MNSTTRIALITIITLVVLLFQFSRVNAQNKKVLATKPDTMITISDTKFFLKNLRLVEQDGEAVFKANVSHDDKFDWSLLSIELTLFDKNGEIIKNPYSDKGDYLASAYPLNAGEIVKITSRLPGQSAKANSFDYHIAKADYPIRNVVKLVKPLESKETAYSDSLMRIDFSIKSDRIAFSLKNRSGKPLRIKWNDISYIDFTNESHKVMHEGIKFANRNENQSSTVVPPTANYSDEIIPSSNVSYSEYTNEWNIGALFPDLYPAAKSNKGERFSVFMPIQIGDVSKDYFFTFEIIGFERVRN